MTCSSIYKANVTGAEVVLADPFFPSSKTCYYCGAVYDDLKLSDREWDCPVCHAHHHRDINAAKNLEKMALAKLQAN